MNILIVCDPPVSKTGNNVGGTHAVIGCLQSELLRLGYKVILITGELFGKVPSGQTPYDYLSRVLEGLEFDHVHIATQARTGLLMRRYCVANKLDFTTAYHTQIPEYLKIRHGVPEWVGYTYMRWFLNKASRVIVPTPAMAKRLSDRGVKNVVACLHGVDTERFKPGDKNFLNLPRPIWLNVGRVTKEKNTEAFVALDLPGTKVVVGDGPMRPVLQQKYPKVHFAGVQMGDMLAKYYAAADCFVFPSMTDTFGLVLLEALAAGIPVAAYPVTGPIDVVTDPKAGCLDEDLGKAAKEALRLSSADCRQFALQHSWAAFTQRFLDLQVSCRGADSCKNTAARLWRDRQMHLPYRMLDWLVNRTEKLLFGDEPVGPYSRLAKAKVGGA